MAWFFTSGTTGYPKMTEHTHASYGLAHKITGKCGGDFFIFRFLLFLSTYLGPVFWSYRNQSLDLDCKPIHWFLCDGNTSPWWISDDDDNNDSKCSW